MHELSICLSLLDQVEHLARERDASKVERIELQIGPLSGIDPALLRHAYPLAAAGTLAEGAVLDIVVTNVSVQCLDCGQRSAVALNQLRCPACGSGRTRVVSGDELILSRVELVLRES